MKIKFGSFEFEINEDDLFPVLILAFAALSGFGATVVTIVLAVIGTK